MRLLMRRRSSEFAMRCRITTRQARVFLCFSLLFFVCCVLLLCCDLHFDVMQCGGGAGAHYAAIQLHRELSGKINDKGSSHTLSLSRTHTHTHTHIRTLSHTRTYTRKHTEPFEGTTMGVFRWRTPPPNAPHIDVSRTVGWCAGVGHIHHQIDPRKVLFCV